MYRYINAEQVIGTIFMKSLSSDKHEFKNEVQVEELFSISKSLKKQKEFKNQVVIRMSSCEIYNAMDKYSNFFCMQDNKISLSSFSLERYKQDSKEFIDILDSFFCAGIPKDIKENMLSIIR